MPKLIIISGKKFLKPLQGIGFEILRIKGSHHFMYHKQTEKTTVIPVHGNEDVGPGLMRTILRDIDMSVEEYERLRSGK